MDATSLGLNQNVKENKLTNLINPTVPTYVRSQEASKQLVVLSNTAILALNWEYKLKISDS